jgi:biotin operon repressor
VSLSGDGLTLAIGAHTNDGTSTDTSDNRGHVRVYKYISGAWNKLSGDIDGESAGDLSGRSLSLSSDGTTIAIGAPLNDGTSTNTNDDRGHVRVYKIMDMSYIPYGVTLLNLKTAGYSAENLKTAGYSAENLKTAGYSIENLKTAGYSAENLKTAGYSAIKLEMAGYLLTDINNLNYTNVEVETSGELTYALNLSSQNKPIVLTSDIDLRQVPSILYSNTVKQITSSKEIKIYVS